MTRLSLRPLTICVRFARALVCSSLLLAFAFSATAAPDDYLSGFDAANRLYEQGKYADAAAAYQDLARAGHTSAALCYNLGNAFFKSAQLGRAIAAYRQAAHLNPRDPDILANLQFARNQVHAPTSTAPRWQRWVCRLSLNEWTVAASGALWLLFALLSLSHVRPQWRQVLRGWIIFAGGTGAVLVVCLAAAIWLSRYVETAIVVAPEAQVRQGPLDESPVGFAVGDGAELGILDRKDDWLQVTSDSRRIGWIRKDAILVLPGI